MSSPLPPLKTRPPDLPAEVARSEAAPKAEHKVFKPTVAEAQSFEVHKTPAITESGVKAPFQPVAAQPTTRAVDIATLLRSTSGLRNAIILREIFGPPRSMQPLDLVGSV
jgi:hypothetical protein